MLSKCCLSCIKLFVYNLCFIITFFIVDKDMVRGMIEGVKVWIPNFPLGLNIGRSVVLIKLKQPDFVRFEPCNIYVHLINDLLDGFRNIFCSLNNSFGIGLFKKSFGIC